MTAIESSDACNRVVRALPLSSIRKDGETQHRIAPEPGIVADFAALMADGVSFPPIRVWWDRNDYWLADGFQRVAAAELVGLAEFPAEIHHGTLSDAQWDSYSANGTHGARRTQGETERVIGLALQHANAASMSNVQIAKHLHLPEATVRRWRRKLSSSRDEDGSRVVRRGESTYTLSTAGIGKNAKRRRARSLAEARSELITMRETSSPPTRALLNILEKWLSGATTPLDTLEAINRWRGLRLG